MKKSILIVFALLSLSSFAQSINLYNAHVSLYVIGGMPAAFSRFYFDIDSGQGYVDIDVIEYTRGMDDFDYDCDMTNNCARYRREYEDQRSYQLIDLRLPVDGLSVEEGILKYNNGEKETICGEIGRTRLFRNIKLNLNGNCTLKTIVRNDIVNVSLELK